MSQVVNINPLSSSYSTRPESNRFRLYQNDYQNQNWNFLLRMLKCNGKFSCLFSDNRREVPTYHLCFSFFCNLFTIFLSFDYLFWWGQSLTEADFFWVDCAWNWISNCSLKRRLDWCLLMLNTKLNNNSMTRIRIKLMNFRDGFEPSRVWTSANLSLTRNCNAQLEFELELD